MVPVAAEPGDVLLAFTTDGTAFPVRVGELPVVRTIVRGARPLGAAARPDARRAGAQPPRGRPPAAGDGAAARSSAARPAAWRRCRRRARRPTTCPRATACSPSSRTAPATTRSCSRATGKALRLALDGIRPVKTASAGGVAGMRLEREDEVVAATRARDGELLLVLHRRGAGKAVPVADYPAKGRGHRRRRQRVGRHAEALARRPGAHRDRRAAGRRGAGRDLGGRAPSARGPARWSPSTRATVSRTAARTDAGHEVVGAVRVP